MALIEGKLLRRLYIVLVIHEFILNMVFLLIPYAVRSQYFRGVSVRLMIAWVTGAIAYAVKAGVSSDG